MKKLFAIMLLLPVLLACNNKNYDSIVEYFKTNQQLTHKVFDLQDAAEELLDPHSIVVSGNTMTTWNLRSPYLFTTIDIASKRVIKHWGTRGQGPNEFYGSTVDMYVNYLESGLNIWDCLYGKLWFFPNSNLESDSTYFQQIPTGFTNTKTSTPMTYSDFAISSIQIDTSIFVILGGGNDKLFTLFNLKSNEEKEFGDFPPEDMNTQIPAGVRKRAYWGKVRYNSSLKKLVHMVVTSEMFTIYNIKGTNVELVMGNYTTIPKYREVQMSLGPSIIMEYVGNGNGRNQSLTVSDKNIFILYQEYKRVGMEKPTDSNLTADLVLVFDWDGNPVKLYTLDCFVTDINYDKGTNRLYAIHNNPYPEIIYFEL